jgi:hypothetical protein
MASRPVNECLAKRLASLGYPVYCTLEKRATEGGTVFPRGAHRVGLTSEQYAHWRSIMSANVWFSSISAVELTCEAKTPEGETW